MTSPNPIIVEFNYPNNEREMFELDVHIPERAFHDIDAFRMETDKACLDIISSLTDNIKDYPYPSHPMEAIASLSATLDTHVTLHDTKRQKTIAVSLSNLGNGYDDVYMKLDVLEGMSVDMFMERTGIKILELKEQFMGDILPPHTAFSTLFLDKLCDALQTRGSLIPEEEYRKLKASHQLTDTGLGNLTAEDIRERTRSRLQQEAEVYGTARESFEEQMERDRIFNNEPPALGSGDFSRRFQNYLDGRVTGEDLIKGQRIIDEHRQKKDGHKVRFTDLTTGKEVDLIFPRELAEKFFDPAENLTFNIRQKLQNHWVDNGEDLGKRLFENTQRDFRPMLDFLSNEYGETPTPAGKSISDYNDEQARKAGITLAGDESSKRTSAGESSWVDENRLVPAIKEFLNTGGLSKLDTNALVMLVALSADANDELKKRRIEDFPKVSEANQIKVLHSMIEELSPEDRHIYINVVFPLRKKSNAVIHLEPGYSGKLINTLMKCAEVNNWKVI